MGFGEGEKNKHYECDDVVRVCLLNGGGRAACSEINSRHMMQSYF